jgi:hypothetical protein
MYLSHERLQVSDALPTGPKERPFAVCTEDDKALDQLLLAH